MERVHSSIELLEQRHHAGQDNGLNVQLEVVRSIDDCDRSLMDWWADHAPTPLQSPAWLLSWWEAFARPSEQLALMVARLDGQVIGLVPLYLTRAAGVVRVLQWLGSGRACTDFQSIISAPQDQLLMQELLADWLLDRRESLAWNILQLDGLADPVQWASLQQRLANLGCPVQQVSHQSTWRVELQDGWAGFMAGLSKTQRAQARNLLNRFDKNDEYQLRIATGEEIGPALEQVIELHQRRWQATGVSGCFTDDRFRRFVQCGMQRLARRGQAEVILLQAAGQTVSGLLCLCDQAGNRFAYQSGRDPAYEAARVGQMLNFVTIRDACERGLRFVDYLRGDEVYKQRLGARATACTQLTISAPDWTSRLPYNALQLCQQVRLQTAGLRHLANKWISLGNQSSNPNAQTPGE